MRDEVHIKKLNNPFMRITATNKNDINAETKNPIKQIIFNALKKSANMSCAIEPIGLLSIYKQ